jgi:hypothetical protein
MKNTLAHLQSDLKDISKTNFKVKEKRVDKTKIL